MRSRPIGKTWGGFSHSMRRLRSLEMDSGVASIFWETFALSAEGGLHTMFLLKRWPDFIMIVHAERQEAPLVKRYNGSMVRINS